MSAGHQLGFASRLDDLGQLGGSPHLSIGREIMPTHSSTLSLHLPPFPESFSQRPRKHSPAAALLSHDGAELGSTSGNGIKA